MLLVAESENLFNLVMYFAKIFNQQYVFGWLSGLLSNAVNIRRFYIQKFQLFYLINLYTDFDFIIFIENTEQIFPAFKEIATVSGGFPLVLFSANDNYFSPSSFLTPKDEIKVYFYLYLVFYMFIRKATFRYELKY